MTLRYYPDPILRQPAKRIDVFDADLKTLATAMRQVMKRHGGMGLAAPQVGQSVRLIVIEYSGDERGRGAVPFTALVNPEIISKSRRHDTLNEGCLSIPHVEVAVSRAEDVIVAAHDLEGKNQKIRAKGIFARILQHEIDHLDGKLILDYDPSLSRSGGSPRDHDRRPRVMVWGSTEFTLGVLNTIRPDMNVTHIVTEPAKPAGRDMKLTPTVVKSYADTLGIPTIEPTDLKDPGVATFILGCKPDVMIVAAYGRLIPEALYSIPRHGTLNVHPSLLPKYRGPTPIQAAILAGDAQTGVTIMKLAPTFDSGDIVAQAPYALRGHETYGQLEYELAELGGEMLNEIIKPYLRGDIALITQNELEASSTHKLDRREAWLNPADSAVLNERKVRAFSPKPGAFVVIDGLPMKIVTAHLEEGNLVFDVVQPAGKPPMPWSDFLRGYRKPLKFDSFTGTM